MDWDSEIRYRISQRNADGSPGKVGYVDAYTLFCITLTQNNAIPCENEPGYVYEFNAYVFKTPAESVLLDSDDEMFRAFQVRPPTVDTKNIGKRMEDHAANMWHADDKVSLAAQDVTIFLERRKELLAKHKELNEKFLKGILNGKV